MSDRVSRDDPSYRERFRRSNARRRSRRRRDEVSSVFTRRQQRLAEDVIERFRAAGLRLATAESCTGGLIAGCLTSVSGSSAVFDRGFVTYDNGAKTEMLGVSDSLLAVDGAVSEGTARAMAEGALSRAPTQVSIAVTGIAGPQGGTESKPVGLVHIAAARTGHDTLHERHVFTGDRQTVRMAAVEAALALLIKRLS
jgi:nicotinamide-nucleotide amidase